MTYPRALPHPGVMFGALERIAQVDPSTGRPLHDQRAMFDIAIKALGWTPIDWQALDETDGDVYDPVRLPDPAEPFDISFEATTETWARDHHGELYRRPNGHVIYMVIGATDWSIEVRRSSDGRVSALSLPDLTTKFLPITRDDITAADAWNLGLP